jgi:hypothetical protein
VRQACCGPTYFFDRPFCPPDFLPAFLVFFATGFFAGPINSSRFKGRSRATKMNMRRGYGQT